MQLNKALRVKIIFSVFLLLIIGYLLAKYLSDNKQTAWIYITGFYAVWLILSLIFLVNIQDIKKMFSVSKNWQWNLLFVPIIALVVYFIFIPNLSLFKWDYWLLLNAIICLVNPFLEEIYWRGLVSKISNIPLNSFLFSSFGFAASHSLILGINSPGVAGITGFAGSFLIGSLFWLCYFKTKSLRGCIINHFLIDVAGMAVFILADKAELAPISFH
jgi:membrane protease YdiL (CAAX protease family)